MDNSEVKSNYANRILRKIKKNNIETGGMLL